MPNKTRGFLLSPRAEHDLEDIWLYSYRTWSKDQADRYHAGLIAAITGLAAGDKTGRDASDLRDGYRKFSVGRHVLFYRECDEHIAVIRILHQSMDVSLHLDAEDS